MNKRILFIFVLIMAVAAAGFWFFSKNNKIPEERGNVPEVNWEDKLPEIESALRKAFPEANVGEIYPVGIREKSDLTGDGVEEALVLLGSGGAYTEQLSLARIKNDKVEMAKFKQREGAVSPLVFLSGASVRNGESVKLAPGDKAVASVSWRLDPMGNLEQCEVDVYLWNRETEVFEYDSILSDGSKSKLCDPLVDF